MAGVIEEIQFAMDEAAINQLIAESARTGEKIGKQMTDAIGSGGKDRARTVANEIMGDLERNLERQEARVKESLARGLISEDGARKAAEANARAYNAGILRAMDQLRQKGALTNEAFVEMTGKLKNVGAAASEVDKVSTSTSKLTSLLTRAGGIMAGFFAVNRIKAFGASSIQEFAKDEAALDRLDSALRRMGTSADALAPQLRELEGRMRALRLDEDETQEILGTLIGRTNKVAESFENVGLVVALARREHLDFASAAQIVANLMNGNIMRIRQFGINATNAKDALAELRRETLGEGEKWAATLTGRLTGLNVLWGNFKSAVGQAMIEAGGGSSVIDTLAATIQTMTKWVMENHDAIREWKDAIFDLLKSFGEMLKDLDITAAGLRQWRKDLAEMEHSLNILNAALTTFAGNVREKWGDLLQLLTFGLMGKAIAEDGRRVMEEGDRLMREADSRWRATLNRIAGTGDRGKVTPDEGESLGSIRGTGAGGIIPVGPGGGGGRDAVREAAEAKRAAQELEKAHDDLIQNAMKLVEVESTRALGLRLLEKEETDLKKQIDSGTLSLEDRVKKLQQLNDVQKAIRDNQRKLDPEFVKAIGGQIDRQLGISEPVKTGAEATAPADVMALVHEQAAHATDNLPTQFPSVRDAFDDMLADMRENSADVADDIAGHFSDAFAQMRKDGFTLNSILSNLGKGLAKSILGEIQKVAKGEALQALANAIKFTAIGIGQAATGNPNAGKSFAAAGTFAKSAIAWGALAGTVGAIGGGGAGGSEGGGAGGGADRTSSIDNSQRFGPEINIYLDGVDPRNPRHQEVISEAGRIWQETTGGQIAYHPGAPR